jgi:hypothetical protein
LFLFTVGPRKEEDFMVWHCFSLLSRKGALFTQGLGSRMNKVNSHTRNFNKS